MARRVAAAIVDSVTDFDEAAGCAPFDRACRIIQQVKAERLTVEWLLEAHVHADHLSTLSYRIIASS